jgi:peroxiredoxin
MGRKSSVSTFRSRHDRPPAGGVLSLTGLEEMSECEKTAAVKALATDMAASIIYVARQAEAGNLTADQTTPIYNLISNITLTERTEREDMLRDLAESERRLARLKRQHRRIIHELMQAATIELKELKRRLRELEAGTSRARPKSEEALRSPAADEGGMDIDRETEGDIYVQEVDGQDRVVF